MPEAAPAAAGAAGGQQQGGGGGGLFGRMGNMLILYFVINFVMSHVFNIGGNNNSGGSGGDAVAGSGSAAAGGTAVLPAADMYTPLWPNNIPTKMHVRFDAYFP